ncbi:MAG TPA: hypothetical protein EYP10_11890 [Armatimonadetes bacterium]|nr:hypothetical protein [Armatimonadota bacterium]
MGWLKRDWTPEEADEWTKEDWIAIVLAPLGYILLMLGVALSLLALPIGYALLVAGVMVTFVMHWVIDPKLRSLSEEYERRQKAYLEELERIERWQE